MGSPATEPERLPSDAAVVQVAISRGFWLGKYEITQSQWKQVMNTTVADQVRQDPGWQKPHAEGDFFPIYYVTDDEASEFCRKLTAGEQKAGRLPVDWSYKLPTDAQWEYACRAGTTTSTSFGDGLSSLQANFNGKYPYGQAANGPNLDRATVAGIYPPTPGDCTTCTATSVSFAWMPTKRNCLEARTPWSTRSSRGAESQRVETFIAWVQRADLVLVS